VEKSGGRIIASSREFSARLIARSFNKQHKERRWVYEGIGLTADPN
jgi:hypothetical protein